MANFDPWGAMNAPGIYNYGGETTVTKGIATGVGSMAQFQGVPTGVGSMARGGTSTVGGVAAGGGGGAAGPFGAMGPASTTPGQTLPQQENALMLPRLNAYMQGDPSAGYSSQLQALMQGNFSTSDPSYQWRFQQGQQAVERSAAAKGLLQSGNAALELQNYGQNAASQEYQAQFSRVLQALGQSESSFQSGYSRLAELAGMTAGQQENTNNLAMQSTTLGANMALGYNQLAERASEANMQNALGYAQVNAGVVENATRAQTTADAQYQQMVNQQQTTQGFEDALIQQQWAQASMGLGGSYIAGAMPGYSSGSVTVG